MNSPPDPLDHLLDKLRPPPTAPLAREVWSRIAAADNQASTTPLHPGLWATIEAVFRQPAFAVAFVVACGLFGLLLAEMRVSRMHEARDVQLVQSYIRLIDPLLAAPTLASNNPVTPSNTP